MTTKRVLPAEVFDFLDRSAEAYGGIGAYSTHWDNIPFCVYGHISHRELGWDVSLKYAKALQKANIWPTDNDMAVDNSIEKRDDRISFKQWCDELNVHRGK